MPFNILHPLYPKRGFTTSSATASQSLTVSTAAVGFATSFNANTNIVDFDVQDSAVRVRWDGTDPTSTVGHILPAFTGYSWDVQRAAAAKFIRISTASSDATIFASESAG